MLCEAFFHDRRKVCHAVCSECALPVFTVAFQTVTKTGTGTWDVRLADLGLEDVWTQGVGDAGTPGRGDAGRENVWGSGTWDVGTRGCDKQTTPGFGVGYLKYNFRCSRERYFTFFSARE